MERPTPDPTDVAMERLRSQIALARARLAEAERVVAEAGQVMVASETPTADHAYRVARDERSRVRLAVHGLEASLGRLVLDAEAPSFTDPISA